MPQYDNTKPLNIDELIRRQQDAERQPRMKPREVLAQFLQNTGGGIGAGAVVGVSLYVAGAPESWIWQGTIFAGIFTWGGLLAWRAGLDEFLDWRKIAAAERQMKQRIAAAERQAQAERQRLEMAYDAIEELEAANTRLTFERDNALLEVQRVRNERPAAKSAFVPASNTQPQVVIDATALLQHWYSQGAWLSRRAAMEQRKWSERRHDEASRLLKDAGLLVTNNGGGRIMAATEGEALGRLNAYCITVNLGPQIDTEHSPASGGEW